MYFDAHCHLQDPRLLSLRPGLSGVLDRAAIGRAVVNGTAENDWEAVGDLARTDPRILPAFGIHPWFAAGRSPDWLPRLEGFLDAHPRSSIGEIGLDRWKEPCDFPDQMAVFSAQLRLATARELPVSIHCLKAWGALRDLLEQSAPLPPRGFLLHSFSGPAEMIRELVGMGAYFSFSPHFLHLRKERQRNAFAQIPPERLLAETDAPDMAPPPELDRCPPGTFLEETAGGHPPLNHPANIAAAYAGLAGVRGISAGEMAALLEGNFTRFFLSPR